MLIFLTWRVMPRYPGDGYLVDSRIVARLMTSTVAFGLLSVSSLTAPELTARMRPGCFS